MAWYYVYMVNNATTRTTAGRIKAGGYIQAWSLPPYKVAAVRRHEDGMTVITNEDGTGDLFPAGVAITRVES